MTRFVASFCRRRSALAGVGLCIFSGALVVSHDHTDDGVGSADVVMPAATEVGFASPDSWHTGNVVVDLVEPDDGEGGSEVELAEWVDAVAEIPGLTVRPAGFYSEGEHLFIVGGSVDAVARLRPHLDSPLVEGVESELIYALPEDGVVAVADNHGEGPGDGEANRRPRVEVNDPMFRLQWHMEQIHAAEAWSVTRGRGAVVAVIDTGVAWRDGDGVKALPDMNGTEFVAGESFIAGLPEGLDDHAHGSHVAGTIAQTTNNGIGVVGVAHQSKIMPLKVLSKDGRGSVPGIANAIRYAADHGAHVINMSLGGPLPSKVLAKAIEYAHSKGVVTVCAAGNERRSRVGYPAANKHAIAVSATDYARELTFYSNWGKDIDVAAPGGDTRADKNGDGQPDGVLQNTIKIGQPLENDYLWFQGTSMASPHAAGVAALIVSTGVTNPDEVERIMKTTAVHPKGAKWDQKYGAGIVDAEAAVVAAHKGYGGERAGLLGLLWLVTAGVLGVMTRGTSLWRRLVTAASGLGALAWASGVVGTSSIAGGLALATAGWGGVATLVVLSAALPLLATLVLLQVKSLRAVLVGLTLGYAAFLLHGALVLPTWLSALPGEALDRLWLGANALVSFVVARRLTRMG